MISILFIEFAKCMNTVITSVPKNMYILCALSKHFQPGVLRDTALQLLASYQLGVAVVAQELINTHYS